jgi:hypothetical protein
MTTDWNTAAAGLKRDVREHRGFLTMQRDALRERFDVGRLTEGIAQDLRDTLYEHGLKIFPDPYEQVTFRVYDMESEVGRIALAVADPQGVPERALVDAVRLHERANAGKDRRSDDAPWLSAFDVFLQIVIGRPPDGWEDLDDDRELFQLVADLAKSLELPAHLVDTAETRRMAGAVCAYRPRVPAWEKAPPALGVALAEAARDHRVIFEGVLREAAKHLLGGAEIPVRNVELGRLGLRYRREAQGDI